MAGSDMAGSNGQDGGKLVAPNGTGRDTKGKFVAGNKASRGRRGAPVKFSEAFLADFHDTWRKHGKDALEMLAKTNHEAFIKAALAVLPRVQQYEAQIAIEHTHRSEFDIELTDFAMAYEKFGRAIGADQRLLELQAERDDRDEERDEH